MIDNYTIGTNDPYVIDSVGMIAFQIPKPQLINQQKTVLEVKVEPQIPATKQSETKKVISNPIPLEKPPVINPIVTTPPIAIEQKFITREKFLVKEIPLTGDSIELRFYDNAEIDGDSISLFLNDTLLFSHIRLTGKAYSIKLAVADMLTTNELTMVAENLGTIPPNTSYMVAIVNNIRYDAYLASTEGSSAMIRFIKK